MKLSLVLLLVFALVIAVLSAPHRQHRFRQSDDDDDDEERVIAKAWCKRKRISTYVNCKQQCDKADKDMCKRMCVTCKKGCIKQDEQEDAKSSEGHGCFKG
jgi:hypothetical protein